MRKLRLDDLQVESFTTSSVPDSTGTVAANTGKMSLCQHICIPEEETTTNPTAVQTCPSCYQTCYTCGQNTCQYTCDIERMTCGEYQGCM